MNAAAAAAHLYIHKNMYACVRCVYFVLFPDHGNIRTASMILLSADDAAAATIVIAVVSVVANHYTVAAAATLMCVIVMRFY